MPPVPPEGWLHIVTSKHNWVPASEGRKRSEELRIVETDACPTCAAEVEVRLRLGANVAPT
jgi:hypothetical protein